LRPRRTLGTTPLLNRASGGFRETLPRGIAALVTSVLVFLSFPNYGISALAWFAFVPLLLAINGMGARNAFFTGLLAGFAAQTAIFFWIYEVDGFRPSHGIILGAYLGLYTAIWCGILTLFPSRKLTFPALGAAAWILMDYLAANTGFLAFSWATLGRTQHTNLPVLQIAEFAGEYGVSFLVMLVNICTAQAIHQRRWRPVLIAGVIFAAVYAWGLWRLNLENPAPLMRVAAIQPALERRLPGTGPGTREKLTILEELSLKAVNGGAELLVWPESMIYDWRTYPDVMSSITDMAERFGVPFVIGVSENEKFVYRTADTSATKPDRNNSAILVSANGGRSLPYHKNLLVPFSEYIPLEGLINWPEWLVSEIVPLEPGNGYRNFPLPNRVRLSPIICWENLFADFVRLAVPEPPGMLIHLVNDNWFGRSPASVQHNAASVFRAIENGIPLIVASNTGPSVIIGSRGRILTAVEGLFTPGIAIADIAASTSSTFYSRHGEVFIFINALVIFLTLAWQLVRIE